MIGKTSLFALAAVLEGIPILGTLRGTPAARAGLRYGDVLLSVNGVRTRTVEDYVEASAVRGDGMEIVYFRGGVERVSRLTYENDRSPKDAAAILAELIDLRIAGDPDGS